MLAALDEQVEEVGLAVHSAHHAGLGQVVGGLGAVAQSLNPTKRLLLLARLGAFGLGVRGRGRVEPGAQHAERHAVGIDRESGVQVQAAGQRAGLVRANRPQPLGLTAPGEVHAGAIEHTQHRGFRLHPLQRARAMGREDVLDRHLGVAGWSMSR